MREFTRAKAKAISPEDDSEEGRRGLTGSEFVLLMLAEEPHERIWTPDREAYWCFSCERWE